MLSSDILEIAGAIIKAEYLTGMMVFVVQIVLVALIMLIVCSATRPPRKEKNERKR
jgi:p-aminobenzoyl-glutamate transporter AbgT